MTRRIRVTATGRINRAPDLGPDTYIFSQFKKGDINAQSFEKSLKPHLNTDGFIKDGNHRFTTPSDQGPLVTHKWKSLINNNPAVIDSEGRAVFKRLSGTRPHTEWSPVSPTLAEGVCLYLDEDYYFEFEYEELNPEYMRAHGWHIASQWWGPQYTALGWKNPPVSLIHQGDLMNIFVKGGDSDTPTDTVKISTPLNASGKHHVFIHYRPSATDGIVEFTYDGLYIGKHEGVTTCTTLLTRGPNWKVGNYNRWAADDYPTEGLGFRFSLIRGGVPL